jgi:two-component system response regulator YesN
MKLLICDDDISTIDVIQSHLDCREFGISTMLRAYNGEAAKEIIKLEKPELILCDIGMPICDGLEVLKFIYTSGIQTEFAFLTCYESFEYARAAIYYGAVDFFFSIRDN